MSRYQSCVLSCRLALTILICLLASRVRLCNCILKRDHHSLNDFFFFFVNRQFLLILDVDELQSLRGLSSDNNKLRLFHSDPLDYHSIIDALRGCSGLFYSFEPPSEHPNYDVSFRFSCLSLDCSGVLSSRFKLRVETKSLMLIFINLLGAGIHG